MYISAHVSGFIQTQTHMQAYKYDKNLKADRQQYQISLRS